jgi:excisionase family DNA binding protein
MQDHPPQPPYSVKRLAELLGCSEGLVYRAVQEKRIPSFRLGAKYFVPARVVEALAEGRDPEPRTQ